MVLKREDLEYGLFENQFSRDGHRKVNDVIECLEDLQLIRKTSGGQTRNTRLPMILLRRHF